LGSNVGTTLTSWIVATVGFKLDIESYSMPVIAVSLSRCFVQEARRLYNFFRLFFALEFISGLGFMKASAENFVNDIVDLL
jgi:phosphate:Na+ symporter